MFANMNTSPEQQQWKAKAAEEGRAKAVSPGYKCACGEASATYAKSAKMHAGEGIGAAAFRLCSDCKCYACDTESPEIKTR
jgi:hypothetical protein